MIESVEKKIVFLMIVCLPVLGIPKRYTLPVLGNNLSNIILYIGVLFLLIYSIKYGEKSLLYMKKFWLIFGAWSILCVIIGACNFPFYTSFTFEKSRTIQFILTSFPGFSDNNILNRVILFFSALTYLIRDYIVMMVGTVAIIYCICRKNWQDGYHVCEKGAFILACILCIYSIPELIWLWTQNSFCAEILSTINQHLYDVQVSRNWYPPLLWQGQLRSLCLEPSQLGTIGAFIFPFLWNRIADGKSNLTYYISFQLTVMILATQSRTAIFAFLAEVFLLISIIVYLRKKEYIAWIIKIMSTIAASAVFFFGVTTAIGSVDNYFSHNISSVAGIQNRSNSSRYGITAGLILTGVEHPIFGVGHQYEAPYVEKNLPGWAENEEVCDWTETMHENGFITSAYPVLNIFAGILARNGFIGLLLFLVPPGIIFLHFAKKKRETVTFQETALLVGLGGQFVCLFAGMMFCTYPIILSLLWSRMYQKI